MLLTVGVGGIKIILDFNMEDQMKRCTELLSLIDAAIAEAEIQRSRSQRFSKAAVVLDNVEAGLKRLYNSHADALEKI